MRDFPSRLPLIIIFLGGMLCGCSPHPATAPVSGKVVYQGKPLEFGSVMFQPVGGPPARSVINSDGTFVLSTYEEGDGATIGRHRIRVTCFESQSPDALEESLEKEMGLGRNLIPDKYLSIDTSGLSFEVQETGHDDVLIELQD